MAARLFAAMFLLYFSTSFGVFLYGDDISMFQVTESIVQRRGLTVSASPFPLSSIGLDGQRYSKYGLGQSLLAVPFYLAGSAVNTVARARETVDTNGVLRTS